MESCSFVRMSAALAAWLMITTVSVAFGAATKPSAAKPDLSTPKSAAAAVVKAMADGDAAAIAAATVGNAREVEWVRAYAAQLRALRDLDAALAKRFGEAYTGLNAAKEIR